MSDIETIKSALEKCETLTMALEEWELAQICQKALSALDRLTPKQEERSESDPQAGDGLLPCPWCQSSDIQVKIGSHAWAECLDCGARCGAIYIYTDNLDNQKTIVVVKRVWNSISTRPASPAPEQREGLDGEAIQPILAEVEKAVRKFPTWPTDPLHALAVLGEEFGELTKSTLQMAYEPHKTSVDEMRTEAIQTAAMALRFYLSLDTYVHVKSEQHEQPALTQPAPEQREGLEPEPIKMQVNNDWLRKKVESDPDLPCEVAAPEPKEEAK